MSVVLELASTEEKNIISTALAIGLGGRLACGPFRSACFGRETRFFTGLSAGRLGPASRRRGDSHPARGRKEREAGLAAVDRRPDEAA